MKNSASIQPRTSLSKFAKNSPQVRHKFAKKSGTHTQDQRLAAAWRFRLEDPDSEDDLGIIDDDGADEWVEPGDLIRERSPSYVSKISRIGKI